MLYFSPNGLLIVFLKKGFFMSEMIYYASYKFKGVGYREPLRDTIYPVSKGRNGVKVHLFFLLIFAISVSNNDLASSKIMSVLIITSLIGMCLSTAFQTILSEQIKDGDSIFEKLDKISDDDIYPLIVESKKVAFLFGWIGVFGTFVAIFSTFFYFIMSENGFSIASGFVLFVFMLIEFIKANEEWSSSSKITSCKDFKIDIC